MALRVDRQAALDWLGIEGFRPSGRVMLPERIGPVEAGLSADEPPLRSASEPGASAPRAEAGPARLHDERPDGEMPAEPSPVVPDVQQGASEAPPEDVVLLAADSAYRGLGEAIARMSGLPCREAGDPVDPGAPGDEGVRLDGRVWPMTELAGNAAAKRRLWQALARRTRHRG